MRILGLVAVRMKSSRLKSKALADLRGKPLIARLASRVSQCRRLTGVVLCTSTHPEDDVLEQVGKDHGISVFRGHEDDVMRRFLDCVAKDGADHVVRITGDNPLMDPGVMETLIDSHLAQKADYSRMDGLPEGVSSEVIAIQALEKAHALSENPNFSEYMTWYFTKNNVFNLNILQAPPDIARPQYRLTVDYEEDYLLVKRIFEEFDFDSNPPTLAEIIRFLDAHPEVAALNANLPKPANLQNINTRLRTGAQ